MEFIGDIVRKKGSRSLLAVEATKARLAGEIGKKIGLYYVPRVLNFDEDTCVLEFERLHDLVILHDLAVRKDQRLPELLRKAGQALAVVHEKLFLPGDMYYPLPSEWVDSSDEDVSIHGDFTLQNVGLNEVSGQLVILDWSTAPLLGRTPTSGSRYFDILWFVANVFSSAPNEGILSWNAEGMSDAFIKGYVHAINPKNMDKFAIYWPKIMRLYRKSVWYIARHRRFCRASVYLAARILMYFRLWCYKRRFSQKGSHHKRKMRILFYFLYHFFAKHLPASCSFHGFWAKYIRYWVCKHLFAKCGKNVNVEHGAEIGSGKYIEIGDNSGIGINCFVWKAIIGKNVMMGPDVVFIPQNHDFSDPDKPLQEQGFIEYEPIVVGDNTWIGTRAIILPGRKIGKCAILGAGSVITKDVPDYAVVGGNPARIIRYRKTIDKQT